MSYLETYLTHLPKKMSPVTFFTHAQGTECLCSLWGHTGVWLGPALVPQGFGQRPLPAALGNLPSTLTAPQLTLPEFTRMSALGRTPRVQAPWQPHGRDIWDLLE